MKNAYKILVWKP